MEKSHSAEDLTGRKDSHMNVLLALSTVLFHQHMANTVWFNEEKAKKPKDQDRLDAEAKSNDARIVNAIQRIVQIMYPPSLA